jgi:hypothetical protein
MRPFYCLQPRGTRSVTFPCLYTVQVTEDKRIHSFYESLWGGAPVGLSSLEVCTAILFYRGFGSGRFQRIAQRNRSSQLTEVRSQVCISSSHKSVSLHLPPPPAPQGICNHCPATYYHTHTCAVNCGAICGRKYRKKILLKSKLM